jgi:hypothetical protein
VLSFQSLLVVSQLHQASLSLFIHAHTDTHTHTLTHTNALIPTLTFTLHMCTHSQALANVHTYTFINTHIHSHTHIQMQIRTSAHTHIFTHTLRPPYSRVLHCFFTRMYQYVAYDIFFLKSHLSLHSSFSFQSLLIRKLKVQQQVPSVHREVK